MICSWQIQFGPAGIDRWLQGSPGIHARAVSHAQLIMMRNTAQRNMGEMSTSQALTIATDSVQDLTTELESIRHSLRDKFALAGSRCWRSAKGLPGIDGDFLVLWQHGHPHH